MEKKKSFSPTGFRNLDHHRWSMFRNPVRDKDLLFSVNFQSIPGSVQNSANGYRRYSRGVNQPGRKINLSPLSYIYIYIYIYRQTKKFVCFPVVLKDSRRLYSNIQRNNEQCTSGYSHM